MVGTKLPGINVSPMQFPWGMCCEVQAEPCPVFLQALNAGACKPLQRQLPSKPPAVGNDTSSAGALSKYCSTFFHPVFFLFVFHGQPAAGKRLITWREALV